MLPVNVSVAAGHRSLVPCLGSCHARCVDAHPTVRGCASGLCNGLSSVRREGTVCRASAAPSSVAENGAAPDAVEHPKPVVKIDNKSDSFATVVSIQFGDQLGDLIDTIAALKNLGLNIRRAKIRPGSQKSNKFYITDAKTSDKIVLSSRLEEIRLTILNNLTYYHPESAEELGWGVKAKKPSRRDMLRPLGPRNRAQVQTSIEVSESESGNYTDLRIVTTDRPGLLNDIVRTLKDISVNVISAEVDTEGSLAIDQFYVTYHGEPLGSPMVQLVTNALQYYLSLADVEKEESY